MVEQLHNMDFHPPKLAGRHISILLYADDAALISRTPIGLKRALKSLAQYCREDQLQLNYHKTKIMVFAKRPKLHHWNIDDKKIEQVPCFKYLGVVFHSSGSRKAHGGYVAENAYRSSSAILKYLRSKGGGQFIPAALKLFEAKSMAQLLYGAQIGPFSDFAPLETVQSKFLRSALQVPKCVCNAILRLETGFLRVEARVWMVILNYWLRLSPAPLGLAPLTMKDNFQSSWQKKIVHKIASLGLSPELLTSMGYDQAKSLVKQRITDIEHQLDLSSAPSFITNGDSRSHTSPMEYLTMLEVANHRRAFTLARCHALPSAVLEGRYQKIPYSERLCPCDSGQIETTEHVLLQCLFYRDIRTRLIMPWTTKYPGCSGQFYVTLLLSDTISAVTYNVAKFCTAAIKIRQMMIESQKN
nr:PREDICTED: uncharacterized protein LOC107983669 [Anolis carolinensis]|eukprot:XP_016853653.1 PREDICTED: uncharacterized protein LOC107983669 [Anolis carolinensis]